MNNNYSYRAGTKADIQAFYNVYRMEHIESYGNFGMSVEEVAAELDFPNFDMAQHTQYVFDEAGEMVAYAELRVWRAIPVRPNIYAYVMPEHRGKGIGSKLTEWGIKQAECFIPHVPDHARVVLQAFSNLEDGQKLLEDFSFRLARESYLMGIELKEGMPKANFAPNFRLVRMSEHPILADFVRIYQETFKDHRGGMEESLEAGLERWERIMESGDFPPENFVLVKDGDEDAAILIMANKSDEDPDKGYIQTVGVMPNYRRQGIATQLLYLAFEHFYKMGKAKAGLSVDGASLTKAHEVYLKAGMNIEMVYNAYELEVREGVELTKQ
jgi:mycothiol synthase